MRLGSRSGQMLIFTTLSVFFLFSIIGLAVDLGYSYFKKLQTQAAADAAASAAAIYAGANGSVCGAGGVVCGTTYSCLNPPTSPPTTAMQAGCLYAQANGFLNAGSQSVSLISNNTTPPNETGNSPSYWVQANISETVPHLFLYWAGFQSGSVASQAIAGITVTPASSCVYVLSNTASQALTITGAASLTATDCGVYVNSSANSAIYMTGSAAIRANQIKVHGTTNICAFSCSSTPTPTTGAPTVADPFASLPAPTVPTGCYKTSYNLASSNTDTISPNGTFCGGITVGGAAHLIMNGGTYIINGGGFNVGNSGIVTANGPVTIFLTGNSTWPAAGMQLSGNSTTTLSAPSSGTYQGVLFYQDRNVTYTTGNAQGGSAHLNATGSFYFPTTAVSLSGAVAASKIAMICSTLSITGSASFTQDTTGAFTGLASRGVGLFQ